MEESDATWAFLFKFGQREHLEALRNDGLIFLNRQAYFQELERDRDIVRADRFEGVDVFTQPDKAKRFTLESNSTGEIIDLTKKLIGPVLLSRGRLACNIYCMFSLTSVPDGPVLDERMSGFGDSYLVVLNTQEFVDRVLDALAEFGVAVECGFVKYFDESSYSGEVGPFRKPSCFAYQNEFRFVTRPGFSEPIKVYLGDLRSITSEIYPSAKFNQNIKIEAYPDE